MTTTCVTERRDLHPQYLLSVSPVEAVELLQAVVKGLRQNGGVIPQHFQGDNFFHGLVTGQFTLSAQRHVDINTLSHDRGRQGDFIQTHLPSLVGVQVQGGIEGHRVISGLVVLGAPTTDITG